MPLSRQQKQVINTLQNQYPRSNLKNADDIRRKFKLGAKMTKGEIYQLMERTLYKYNLNKIKADNEKHFYQQQINNDINSNFAKMAKPNSEPFRYNMDEVHKYSSMKKFLDQMLKSFNIYLQDKQVMMRVNHMFYILNQHTLSKLSRLIEGQQINQLDSTQSDDEVIVELQDVQNVTFSLVSTIAKRKNHAGSFFKYYNLTSFDFSGYGIFKDQKEYEGQPMEIGFKSTFLIEILSNLSSEDVKLKLSDPSRAGLLVPAEKELDYEDVLMLLMPMMINA